MKQKEEQTDSEAQVNFKFNVGDRVEFIRVFMFEGEILYTGKITQRKHTRKGQEIYIVITDWWLDYGPLNYWVDVKDLKKENRGDVE